MLFGILIGALEGVAVGLLSPSPLGEVIWVFATKGLIGGVLTGRFADLRRGAARAIMLGLALGVFLSLLVALGVGRDYWIMSFGAPQGAIVGQLTWRFGAPRSKANEILGL